jgi:flagellar secretion chaperone FliS
MLENKYRWGKKMSKAAKAYSKTEVQTGITAADSNDLIIMVYERLFDNLKIGKKELENGGYAIEVLSAAHDLIQKGLLACLDYELGGEIALNLGLVYEWAMRNLIAARIEKSPLKIQEIIDVLTPLYEGWLSINADHSIKIGIPKLATKNGEQVSRL